MRDPDHDEPQVPGGRAAERLRQFLASRYGDAPPDLADPTQSTDEVTAPETDDENQAGPRRPADPDA
jgi:hypothetical protein